MIYASGEHKGTKAMATVAEAAGILGVSPRRVLQFITEGRLPAQRVTPRLYLLNVDDVRRFAKKPRETGNPNLRKSSK